MDDEEKEREGALAMGIRRGDAVPSSLQLTYAARNGPLCLPATAGGIIHSHSHLQRDRLSLVPKKFLMCLSSANALSDESGWRGKYFKLNDNNLVGVWILRFSTRCNE